MATAATVHEERIDSAKGVKIFVRSWQPASTPRAVVIICHGVNSHGGQYTRVGEQFAASGLAAYALDGTTNKSPRADKRLLIRIIHRGSVLPQSGAVTL